MQGADNAPKDESVEVVVERHEPLHEAPQGESLPPTGNVEHLPPQADFTMDKALGK